MQGSTVYHPGTHATRTVLLSRDNNTSLGTPLLPAAVDVLYRTAAAGAKRRLTVPWALFLGLRMGGGSFASQVSSSLFSFVSRLPAGFPDRPHENG